MALENNSTNFMGFMVGDVLEVEQASRRVAVYLPKLMPGIGGDTQVSSDVQTSQSASVSGLNFSQTIRVRNSMWVGPYDYDEPLPAVGSKVVVFFIDGNPNLGYWDKFNPNSDYRVIDEERYPKLATLRLANTTIDVNRDDTISVDLPSEFYTTLSVSDKDKRISVIRDQTYVISPEEPSDPKAGTLWFNTSDEGVYAFSRGKFNRLLTRDDVADVYAEVDRISAFLESTLEFWASGRLMFLPSYSSIASTVKSPVQNQIVVIDPQIEDDAFYKYTSLEAEAALTEDGFYFLQYANLVVERSLGIERQLDAYLYNGTEWERMDGWFGFTQPAGSLGDFLLSTGQTVNTTDTYEWDFRTQLSNTDLDLKVFSLKFEGITISSGTSVTFQFYSGSSASANTTTDAYAITGIASTADIRAGDYVSGSGIPSGTRVVSIDSDTSVSVDQAATATATGVSLSFRRNIGAEFTMTNTGGTYSIDPARYESLYFDSGDLFVPDISRFGVEVQNIRCDVESDASTTLDFGSSIVLDARSSEEVA